MATLSQLLAARDTAGSAYAAALAAFRSALIDLAAIDNALRNARVSAGMTATQREATLRTFHGLPQALGQEFVHPVYAGTANASSQSIYQSVQAGEAAHIAAFTEA